MAKKKKVSAETVRKYAGGTPATNLVPGTLTGNPMYRAEPGRRGRGSGMVKRLKDAALAREKGKYGYVRKPKGK